MLRPDHQRQIAILTRVEAGTLSLAQAAEVLGCSTRHLRRLRARFRSDGPAAVVHGNQGRPAANRLPGAVVARIRVLAGPDGPYRDCNASHLHALLAEREGIVLGRSTWDRLLKQERLRRPRRERPTPIRRRRERRSAEGLLVQVDGSFHAWLEDRGPKLCLLGAIDDATGRVLVARFRPTEDQVGYLVLFRTLCTRYGLPATVYHDRHTILRSPKRPDLDDELAGIPPMSQIQRVLHDLGSEAIAAHSPQAKGRSERLWGTFQDRLVKELRLADITTLEAANAFLPPFLDRYNARFARPPADPDAAWVPLPDDCDLTYYFATRETRRVRGDHTIAWFGQTLQLQRGRREPSLAGQSVTVHQVPEGDLAVYQDRQRLSYTVITRRPPAPPAPVPVRRSVPPDPAALARRRAWLFGDHPADTIPEHKAVRIAEQ